MSHYTLGIDTSNYATSLAVFHTAGEVVCAKKRFLPVKEGQLGPVSYTHLDVYKRQDEAMDKNQRDYYLHEQMHMISQELGEDDDTTAEAEEYRRRIQELHLDEEREKKLLKEVDRLAKMQSSNQEGTVIRTYLDTLSLIHICASV